MSPFSLGNTAAAPNPYDMSSRPRGICLIINNTNFQDKSSVREGAEFDVEELEKLFKKLFFTVQVHSDLECEQMRNVAKECAGQDHSQFDAFVFIIMSHGADGDVIVGVNGREIKFEYLMAEFTFNACKTLQNKPKLFFVQTCRGASLERLSTASGGAVRDAAFTPDSTLPRSVCPKEADFLLAFATPPGYVAWRNRKRGSQFIQVNRNKY